MGAALCIGIARELTAGSKRSQRISPYLGSTGESGEVLPSAAGAQPAKAFEHSPKSLNGMVIFLLFIDCQAQSNHDALEVCEPQA